VTSCIRLFYLNSAVCIVLGHKGSLVISFPINRTQGLVKRIKHSTIPLPPPSHSCVLRGVGVLHGVRGVRGERERFLQFFKECEDVVAVSTPCKLLICINTSVSLDKGIPYLVNCKERFFCIARDIRYQKVILFIIEEQISMKSMMGLCVNPCATSLVLYLMTS
jgi:hypothetical protein